MARNNRHNTAFVVGSVLGAIAGAAAALWKTPYTGEELRAKLTGPASRDSAEAGTLSATPSPRPAATDDQRSIKGKVLSGVEKTLAPIVGVQLGKTANGSGPLGSDIKVNKDLAGSGNAGQTSVSRAADGTETIGLSLDRVDAEKWAAAYAGTDTEAESTPVSTNNHVSQTTSMSGQTNASHDTPSGQDNLLRHPHAWHEGSSETSVTHAADGTEMIGLSRDKVDADKWAAAYAGTDIGSDTTTPSDTTVTNQSQVTQAAAPAAPAASTDTTSGQPTLLRHPHAWHGGSSETSVTHAADGSTMIGLSRDKVDADKWAAAYAGETVESAPDPSTTQTTSTTARDATGTTSKAAESAAQTGRGAEPAFPDSDHIGHPPANKTAPDSNVGDVSRGASSGAELHSVSDAATIDQLTKPQTDRVPDSLRAPTDHAAHPFPKLGGHED